MEFYNEQQQVEQLKKWWHEYGVSLVVGIILAICIVLGIRFFQHYENQKSEKASMLYTTLINGVLANQVLNATEAANSLITDFSSTPYASVARLWLANQAVSSARYADALKQLAVVMNHARIPAFKQVARIESAKIQLQQGQPKEALQLLSQIDDKAYEGLVAEVKGDAYWQLNELNLAREQYEIAMKKIPDVTQSQPVLAMKLADLPVVAH